MSALDSLVMNKSITPDGKDWLVTALDPFHDFNHQIAGYPDADVSQTVVACYQYEATITKPAGLASGNWNAHVWTMPVCSSTKVSPVYQESASWSQIYDASATPGKYALAPLNVFVTTGEFGPEPTVTPNGADITVLPQQANEDILSGVSRVVAMGFEVHNTTAEIYKQGSVTTYRMPQSVTPNQTVWRNSSSTSWSVLSGHRIRAPPLNTAHANLLKGTRTWEAKDGVYATCFQSSVHNPLMMANTSHVLVEPLPDAGIITTVQGNVLNPVLPSTNPSSYTPDPTQIAPFDTTGAMFMGLSNETTLQVKLRIYVERAPTWTEPSLAVLASPSAGYDNKVLELYAAAINYLPPAVMVGENAMGDWWKAVMNVVAKIAGPVGLALNSFVPGAGVVGGAIQTIAGQLNPNKSVSSQAVVQRGVRVVKQPGNQKKDGSSLKKRFPARK